MTSRRTLFVACAAALALLLSACLGPTQFAVCDCSGNLFDCGDFSTRAEAQNCYESCFLLTNSDIHRLDGDGNGLACESFDYGAGGGVSVPTAPIEVTPPDLPNDDFEEASVISVIDGDTIDVLLGGEEFRVRYIGINTPESDESCFGQATQANQQLVAGRTVLMTMDISETDRFGRLLRYVFVEDAGDLVFVNEALVLGGFAEAARFPPDTTFADYFESLEAAADANNLGCHPTGVFD